MSLEKIKQRQQKEVEQYQQARAQRAWTLYLNQDEILNHCLFVTPKGNELLKALLEEQRRSWEEQEKNDLDMLLHIQQLELESYSEKQSNFQRLVDLLTPGTGKKKDRGR